MNFNIFIDFPGDSQNILAKEYYTLNSEDNLLINVYNT